MKTIPRYILLYTCICLMAAPLHARKHGKLEKVEGTEMAEKAEPDDNRNPSGCRDVGYKFDLKTLKLLPAAAGNRQSMYLIHNTSGQTINLYQMRADDSSRTMYLNHSINAAHWAALATSETPIHYVCTASTSAGKNDKNAAKNTTAYGELVDCSQNLHVCEFTDVKFGLNNAGNFWFVNSSTRNGAVREVVHYGIIPEYRMTEARQKALLKKKEAKERRHLKKLGKKQKAETQMLVNSDH